MVTEGKTEVTNREETTLPYPTETTKLIKTTLATIAVNTVITRRIARLNHVPMHSPVKPGKIKTRTIEATKTVPNRNHKSTW